jgi:hypothetical protein
MPSRASLFSIDAGVCDSIKTLGRNVRNFLEHFSCHHLTTTGRLHLITPLAVIDVTMASSSSTPTPASASPSASNTILVHHSITQSTSSSLNSRQRLEGYNSTRARRVDVDDYDPSTVVPLLALQVYHLPNHSYWQDFRQYLTNNHPVFGICCHHPLHPISTGTRIIVLTGSMLFGVLITNVSFLLYASYPQWDQPFLEVDTTTDTDDDENSAYTVSTGMVLLWTVGGGLHAMYNLVIWHVAACACCQPGGCLHVHVHPGDVSDGGEKNAEKSVFRHCPSLGKHLVRLIVLVILVLATWAVLIRVEVEEEVNDDDHTLQVNLLNSHDAQEFDFLLGYLVEMGLALFLWYPLGAMLLFSGVLACGYNLPFLGGRPREVALEQQKKAMLELKRCGSRKSMTTSKTTGGDDDGGDDEDDDVEINPVESSSSGADVDIELVWTPRARQEFEDSRATL